MTSTTRNLEQLGERELFSDDGHSESDPVTHCRATSSFSIGKIIKTRPETKSHMGAAGKSLECWPTAWIRILQGVMLTFSFQGSPYVPFL